MEWRRYAQVRLPHGLPALLRHRAAPAVLVLPLLLALWLLLVARYEPPPAADYARAARERSPTEPQPPAANNGAEHQPVVPAPAPPAVMAETNIGGQQPAAPPAPVTVAPAHSGPPPRDDVHIFYYAWYGTPAIDGAWIHWNHPVLDASAPGQRYEPPDSIGAAFYPHLGPYSSASPDVVAQHMRQIADAGVGVVVLSWYPPGMADENGGFSDRRVSAILDAAVAVGLHVALHVEPFAGRDAEAFRTALCYAIHRYGQHRGWYRDEGRGRRPWIYVYDSYLVPAKDWATVLRPDGTRTIRGTACDAVVIGLYVSRRDEDAIVSAGFDGFYTYFAADRFTHGSTMANWPSLQAWARARNLLFVPSVGPGYDDVRIRPWNARNRRHRNDGAYYRSMWESAISSGAPVVAITSFNEWHEGTQVEPAVAYIVSRSTDAYAYPAYTNGNPMFYLEITADCVKQWATQRPRR